LRGGSAAGEDFHEPVDAKSPNGDIFIPTVDQPDEKSEIRPDKWCFGSGHVRKLI
jgi:hypothetical protein